MERIIEKDDLLQERLELSFLRIKEIREEEELKGNFLSFFQEEAKILLKRLNLLEEIKTGRFDKLSYDELFKWNRELYGREEGFAYEESFVNPTFAVRTLGEGLGREASHLAYLIERSHRFLFSGNFSGFVRLLELFIELYGILKRGEGEDSFRTAFKDFKIDSLSVVLEEMIREDYLPEETNIKKIIMEEDLTNPSYLYKIGLYVNEGDEKVSEYLASLSKEKISAMARTHVNGFIEGYKTMRMDIQEKEGVKILAHLGFERLVREEIRQFQERGLIAFPVLSNEGVNRQVDYDHRNDYGLFQDEIYRKTYLEVYERVLSKYKDTLSSFAGPALIETFGEEDFLPQNKKEAVSLTEEQRKSFTEFAGKKYQVFNSFSPAEKRSFSIIAYPLPGIHESKFEEIFDAIIRINNMDNEKYKRIQKFLIDELDKGDFVHIKGRDGNRTDFRVSLHELAIPEKETNFENCVADVNIPVGEVFTSPKLSGTEGILHVSKVYLNGLLYKDLSLKFVDGKIADYSLKNFEKEEDNKKFIEENLLHHHETLPLGEFAIGTNTLAYQIGIKYDISGKLPILIAEKTGPHFAVGDTCYSMQEEHRLYNPDGKEIVAKENECSALRKTDISKAYFNCHTDITLPYSELGELTVHRRDGSTLTLMKDGRFVLAGTEELNQYLED